MDINNSSFYPELPTILLAISTAHFIAFDLELSGVPIKQPRVEPGKQTLQERYLETKQGAEKFQILQIGITCVKQDVDSGTYILRPYNFDLCPLIHERGLDIERVFSFSSGAAEFLLKVGFDIGRPFQHGVPYLSRIESREAREKHKKRNDRTATAEITIKPTEVESLAFLDRVRSSIDTWQQRSYPSSITIGPNGHVFAEEETPAQEMSRFEKRLVHQVVQAEYPEFVSFTKRGMVQISRYNKEREDRLRKEKKRELEERINRQKGFRWIIDAMLGGSFENLYSRARVWNEREAQDWSSASFVKSEDRVKIQRAQSHLLGNPRVLVGHNCFLDLVYLYRTFIGHLPDTVEEFSAQIHKSWPLVVDTKYMSTHNCGDINPISSLEQISSQLSSQSKPLIQLDERHDRYTVNEYFHEAGFDSFLTAQIMVRLSSKLYRENKDALSLSKNLDTIRDADQLPQMKLPIRPKSTLTVGFTSQVGFTPSNPGEDWEGKGDSTIDGKSDGHFEYNPQDRQHRYVRAGSDKEYIEDGMPRFGDVFWSAYGNKLRVFGTEEAVCMLDIPAASPIDNDTSGGVKLL